MISTLDDNRQNFVPEDYQAIRNDLVMMRRSMQGYMFTQAGFFAYQVAVAEPALPHRDYYVRRVKEMVEEAEELVASKPTFLHQTGPRSFIHLTRAYREGLKARGCGSSHLDVDGIYKETHVEISSHYLCMLVDCICLSSAGQRARRWPKYRLQELAGSSQPGRSGWPISLTIWNRLPRQSEESRAGSLSSRCRTTRYTVTRNLNGLVYGMCDLRNVKVEPGDMLKMALRWPVGLTHVRPVYSYDTINWNFAGGMGKG